MSDYDTTPRPNLEWHPQIRELITTQDKRALEREQSRTRKQSYEERNEDIKKAPWKETKAFYCESCRKDFIGEAIKQVEADWSNTSQSIAFYKTKCFCGKWAMRHITDIHQDRYFAKSKIIAAHRMKHAMDILQQFQTGYNLVWGKR